MPKAKAITAKQRDDLLDQLERSKCLSAGRIAAVRQEIASAERATGPARHDTLAKLASGLEGDARSSCDGPKVQTLMQAVTNLSNTPVP